jgi:hypothetical protein
MRNRLWFDTADIAALQDGEMERGQAALVRAQALLALVQAGYTHESAIAAVDAMDLSQLQAGGVGTPSSSQPVQHLLPQAQPGATADPLPPTMPRLPVGSTSVGDGGNGSRPTVTRRGERLWHGMRGIPVALAAVGRPQRNHRSRRSRPAHFKLKKRVADSGPPANPHGAHNYGVRRGVPEGARPQGRRPGRPADDGGATQARGRARQASPRQGQPGGQGQGRGGKARAARQGEDSSTARHRTGRRQPGI